MMHLQMFTLLGLFVAATALAEDQQVVELSTSGVSHENSNLNLVELDHFLADGDSREIVMELDRRLSIVTRASTSDFEHVCQQLRTIFHEQCSCGDELSLSPARSDQVECDYSDIHAIALFNDDLDSPFQAQKMNSLKVCKHQVAAASYERVCTTILYRNNVGTDCEVTVGGSDRLCEQCDICTTENGFPGLHIGCNNIDSALTTEECTAASKILDLSGAPAGVTFKGITALLLLLIGAIVAIV